VARRLIFVGMKPVSDEQLMEPSHATEGAGMPVHDEKRDNPQHYSARARSLSRTKVQFAKRRSTAKVIEQAGGTDLRNGCPASRAEPS
jgi:hypothetical protein